MRYILHPGFFIKEDNKKYYEQLNHNAYRGRTSLPSKRTKNNSGCNLMECGAIEMRQLLKR